MALRFALCNEIYAEAPPQRRDLREVCRSVQAIGYEGIELAPHTLAEDATQLTAAQRADLRDAMSGAGLQFVGLHWLLVSPPGMHATTADESVRRRTWDYVRRAITLCTDLARDNHPDAPKPVMVFGSPKQRSSADGKSAKEAAETMRDKLARLASDAQDAGVLLLMEAIPSHDTDVITTLREAVALVEQVNRPAVQTMFDVHNTADETEDHGELVRRYARHIRHVHVNERDGREPGMDSYDFEGLLAVLESVKYRGWVSVEAFDFSRPADEIARRAWARLHAARTAVSA